MEGKFLFSCTCPLISSIDHGVNKASSFGAGQLLDSRAASVVLPVCTESLDGRPFLLPCVIFRSVEVVTKAHVVQIVSGPSYYSGFLIRTLILAHNNCRPGHQLFPNALS